jgi:hypothetical protein
MIESSLPWARKHWKTIYLNYKEAPYFAEHRGFFEDLYSKKWERLVDLNLAIIAYVMKALGIERPLALSSEHRITGEKTSMLIDMCQKLGADTYVSGWGGKNYVILDDFRRQGLHHRFVKLNHPQYPQQGQTFIPNLSAVDLLFNCGPESKQILEAACAHSTVEEA